MRPCALSYQPTSLQPRRKFITNYHIVRPTTSHQSKKCQKFYQFFLGCPNKCPTLVGIHWCHIQSPDTYHEPLFTRRPSRCHRYRTERTTGSSTKLPIRLFLSFSRWTLATKQGLSCLCLQRNRQRHPRPLPHRTQGLSRPHGNLMERIPLPPRGVNRTSKNQPEDRTRFLELDS